MSGEEGRVRFRKTGSRSFNQQALRAWKPILTASSVWAKFLGVGCVFLVIGVLLVFPYLDTKEISLEYTDCINRSGTPCYQILDLDPEGECECLVDLPSSQLGQTDWSGNVYIYYGLTNFYQNHRKYVQSRSDKQLLGNLRGVSDNCNPYLYPYKNDTSKIYVPCGAIANSLFSDDIVLEYKVKGETASRFRSVPVSRLNIAWDSDKQVKFRNPDVPEGQTLKDVFLAAGSVKPQGWRKNIWELDLENPDNNGLQNEDLIVWMRTAAMPDFRKLYRRVDHDNEAGNPDFPLRFSKGLPLQDIDYRLRITYRFRVKHFRGTKSVIISTTSLLGGKNPVLIILYIVVGIILILIGLASKLVSTKYQK